MFLGDFSASLLFKVPFFVALATIPVIYYILSTLSTIIMRNLFHIVRLVQLHSIIQSLSSSGSLRSQDQF